MKSEHPVTRVARLVYDRPNPEEALAAELRIPLNEVVQWLGGDIDARTRRLMRGFALKKAETLRQRAHQLSQMVDSI